MTDTIVTGAPDVFVEALRPASSKSGYLTLEVAAVVGDDSLTEGNAEYAGTRDYVSVNAPGLYFTADEADRAADLLHRAATALRAAMTGGAA